MWDLPESGIQFMSPAFAGGFFTAEPPGKPLLKYIFFNIKLKSRKVFKGKRSHIQPAPQRVEERSFVELGKGVTLRECTLTSVVLVSITLTVYFFLVWSSWTHPKTHMGLLFVESI